MNDNKKKYSKPTVFVEKFELTRSVAATCSTPEIEDAKLNGFFAEVENCLLSVEDSVYSQYDGICYHAITVVMAS